MDHNIQTLPQKLRSNNLSAHYVPDRQSVRDLVLSLIPEGAVVGYGRLTRPVPEQRG